MPTQTKPQTSFCPDCLNTGVDQFDEVYKGSYCTCAAGEALEAEEARADAMDKLEDELLDHDLDELGFAPDLKVAS